MSKNPDSDIFLYAKYHYKRTDLLADLKKIMGKRSGVAAEHIRIEDIIVVLMHIVEDLSRTNEINYHPLGFVEITRNYLIFNKINSNALSAFDESVINACLFYISISIVRKDDTVLIELDAPDENLLPLRRIGEE